MLLPAMTVIALQLSPLVLAHVRTSAPAHPRTWYLTAEDLAIQVTLDRAGFSPGVIDGHPGANTQKAADAYRKRHGKDPELMADPVVTYTITDADAAGPFVAAIPPELPDQTKLPLLTYT